MKLAGIGYLAGGLVAFGIVFLTFQIISLYYDYLGVRRSDLYADALSILFVVIHMMGGALGGYLVGRKMEHKGVDAGMLTGVIACAIEYAFYVIFEGSFPGGFWAWLSFVIGGLTGSLFAISRRRRL